MLLRALRSAIVTLATLILAGASAPADAGQECALDIPAGFSGVVLVERAGRIVLDRAYGSVGRENAFWLASTTKQFTAAAILRLADEGKLAVSDSIYHFFARAPRRARTITI
jgi:CubicO group peptidase (beta-lactamase class C family)